MAGSSETWDPNICKGKSFEPNHPGSFFSGSFGVNLPGVCVSNSFKLQQYLVKVGVLEVLNLVSISTSQCLGAEKAYGVFCGNFRVILKVSLQRI